MSTFKDVADSAGVISVGALAMLFGDPSGGTVLASGIAGLGALGLALRNSSAKRARKAAQKQVLTDLESSPDYANANLKRAHFLLTSAPSQMTLSPGDLSNAVKAATDTPVEQELARLIHACIPFEPDDQQIETMLEHAILAGVRACYGDAAFKASMNSALLIRTVQDNDLQITLLEGISQDIKEVGLDVKEVGQDVRALSQQLQALIESQGITTPTVSLDSLKMLAAKFEETSLNDAASLITFLTNKAEEYQSFRAQISALDDRVAAIANLKGAAEDAAARLDFDEVEVLLSRVDEVETEIAAETKQARAANALLRGRAQEAFTILSAAADSFASVDPVEPATRRLRYEDILYAHGLRYGGQGMVLAAIMIQAAIEQIDQISHPELWAQAQNNLAAALQQQGTRTEGAAGTDLLARAVAACDAALSIYTLADHPVHWAGTQNNLAVALKEQGTRTEGAAGTDLLARADAAYDAALSIYTIEDHPVHWAGTQNNLAIALKEQGTRTEGAAGTDLLARAVAAYDAALSIRTIADHPVDWAMTQENLAIAELACAVHPACADPQPHLEAALVYVEGALTVFDPVHMAYNQQKATALRARIKARLDPGTR